MSNSAPPALEHAERVAPTMRERWRTFALLLGVGGIWGVATVPWAVHGMNWSDTGQIFHFGNRILSGDVPYRDFAYQSGVLGIAVDAFFQRIFGATYLTSLGARLLVSLATLGLYGMALRRFATPFTTACVVIGVALVTPVFFNEVLHGGGNNNWANLFVVGVMVFLVRANAPIRAMRADPEPVVPVARTGRNLALAGFLVAGVLAARQSNGVLCLAVTLGVVTLFTARDPRRFLRTLALPFTLGALAGVAALTAALATQGALGPAISELFVGAGEKKNVSALPGIINMLSGGLSPEATGAQILRLVVVPIVGALGVFAIAGVGRGAAGHGSDGRTAARLLVLPVLMGAGLLVFTWAPARPVALLLVNEIPRTFFTLLLAASCLFPRRIASATGLPHPTLPLLVGLVLASLWARKLSFFGQHDAPYDLWVLLVPLVACMIPAISERAKRGMGIAFVVLGATLFGVHVGTGRIGTSDGTIGDARTPLDHPMTRGIRVTQEKAVALAGLREHIQPGDSCFIYGSAAPLYTLLECENPTRLDVTFSDAFTATQAEEAVAALRANPPDWIIEAVNLHSAHIGRKFDGSPRFFGPHGQEAPRILHAGLREMRREYRQVFAVHQLVPPGSIVKHEWEDWDSILNLRLHRRRDR